MKLQCKRQSVKTNEIQIKIWLELTIISSVVFKNIFYQIMAI